MLGPLLGTFPAVSGATSEEPEKSDPVLVINSYISRLSLCHAVEKESFPHERHQLEGRDHTHKCVCFFVRSIILHTVCMSQQKE